MKDVYEIEIVQEHRKDGKYRVVVKFEWVDTMKEMKDMMKFIQSNSLSVGANDT